MTRNRLVIVVLGILVFSASLLCLADSASDRQLLQAVAKGDIGAVRLLLDNDADIESKDDHGDTPLIIAIENRDFELTKLLLEKGANISARNNYEETPVTEAAKSMDPELVRLLLDANPSLNDKNAALLRAAEGGPVVLQISDAPAQGTQQKQDAQNPPELPWVTVVRLLLDSGADIETRDEEGDTPLLRAASFGQTETFKLLVEKGAKINVRNKEGDTPLILAACACAVATMNSTYDIMKILLEKGANANARNHDGTTALMMAAGSPDDSPSVELLLNQGADPRLKDNQGRTAMAFAKDSPFPDKIRLLKKAMGKPRGMSAGVAP